MKSSPATGVKITDAAPFSGRLVAWQRAHGRHDLPWQQTRDAYRVWLSEIMLQQTQVATVLPYYQRFLARFPDLPTLAAAPLEAVLSLWSGLGYYSRARNLHRAAQQLMALHGGRFPADPAQLAELPGVGPSTAAAIAVFCFGARAAILDGNVKRVLARHQGIAGWPGETAVARRLWEAAENLLPEREVEAYTQGLMDLGAGVCLPRQPHCGDCPVAVDCRARLEGRVAELPEPRPRKALPRRETTVLLLMRTDGALLLERRPPAGLWGGLWTLPEVDGAASPEDCCARRWGLRVSPAEAPPPLTHAFTHFSLRMKPLGFRVEEGGDRVEEGGAVWLLPAEEGEAPLPTPVRRLARAAWGIWGGVQGPSPRGEGWG